MVSYNFCVPSKTGKYHSDTAESLGNSENRINDCYEDFKTPNAAAGIFMAELYIESRGKKNAAAEKKRLKAKLS